MTLSIRFRSGDKTLVHNVSIILLFGPLLDCKVSFYDIIRKQQRVCCVRDHVRTDCSNRFERLRTSHAKVPNHVATEICLVFWYNTSRTFFCLDKRAQRNFKSGFTFSGGHFQNWTTLQFHPFLFLANFPRGLEFNYLTTTFQGADKDPLQWVVFSSESLLYIQQQVQWDNDASL